MAATRVGIIGAGQLGRMMALAGYPLGIHCSFVDRESDSPGGQVAPIQVAELDDFSALSSLARSVDVLTFDIENVSVAALDRLADIVPVYPSAAAVAATQDRLNEKQLFMSLGIPTAAFVPVDSAEDLRLAADSLPWPVVLKARKLGYDGRGQRIAKDLEALLKAWDAIGRVPAIAEGWVKFKRELSLIAVRGANGEQAFYPLTENTHRDGILVASFAPYEDPDLHTIAVDWLSRLMNNFDYRGVLTVEFFHTAEGLVANEIAPRVHNSGHWTIEGAVSDQFENHLRAILGWPLGDPGVRGYAGMVNMLGRLADRQKILNIPGAHFHSYGKQARPARKLGHCTLVAANEEALQERLAPLKSIVADANC